MKSKSTSNGEKHRRHEAPVHDLPATRYVDVVGDGAKSGPTK
jgi:hypothetical protein